MKKALLILFILMLITPIIAQETILSEKDQLLVKGAKIEKEVARLEGKLKLTRSKARRLKLNSLISGHRARIEKLEGEMVELGKIDEITEETVIVEEGEKGEARLEFEIGGLAGIFAGATGLYGELRLDLNRVYGPATTSVRLSGGFAQSESGDRRYAPIHIDGILNFPPGIITEVENYIGVGLNYVLRTTGQVPGAIGGEIFYGVQSEGFSGKLFGEIGYGVLRTGFTPAHSGLTLLIGYRRDWKI
ncbi:MAG: hypothetical protein U9R38_00305 [Candidatus Margulisiibacteriota bacterium]|nr:hypothetical protein [Candidatus Margulisiibacteriota bacterium]